MSKIVEALNTDNLILNQQVQHIRTDLEFVCSSFANLHVEVQNRGDLYSKDLEVLAGRVSEISNKLLLNVTNDEIPEQLPFDSKILTEINKKIINTQTITSDIQKQIVDTRSLLLRTINTNIASVKKDLDEVRNIKDNLRPYIKSIVTEEVKAYMADMPVIDRKFNDFVREQRASLSQHIRKSTVQRVSGLKDETGFLISTIREEIAKTDKSRDIEKIKKKQITFIKNVEDIILGMQKQIEDLHTKNIELTVKVDAGK
jgi:hypothetical protein